MDDEEVPMSSSLSSSESETSSSVSSATRRGLKLLRRAQARYITAVTDGKRFQVEAHSAVDMTNAIFRFKEIHNPLTGEITGEFDGVCSTADLEEYAVDQATVGQIPPYFRSSSVDLVLRSQVEAEEAWSAIKEETQVLLDALDLMDDLSVVEEVTFGLEPL